MPIVEALPPEIWDAICEFMGQASAHATLRTCRAIYWALSPRAWRKIVLAPNPEWLDIGVRPDNEDWSFHRNIGHVCRGFLRTRRLLTAIDRDCENPDSLLEGRWRHLSACRELTICEFMEPPELEVLFHVLPHVRKTNIYMGNFLHWYRQAIGGEEAGYEIMPYTPPQIPELWTGSRNRRLRPRTLCEAIPKCLPPSGGSSWAAHNITKLNIDCEAHLQADYNHTRFQFVDELYAGYRLHNKNSDAWFETFPNVHTLKCGTWFLELLWSSCVLGNVTRGRGFHSTDREHGDMLREFGIGGIPKWPEWNSLHTVTIQGYEDEYPEIQYRRDRSIVSPHIWTFLGIFRSLKTIRCQVGPWKRLHRYPGGFDLVPHIESLVGLAALQICQEIHQWDVKIEDFIINLRDIETLTTVTGGGGNPEKRPIPELPVITTTEELGRLLDFIRGIGWTGFVSVPDTTNWWDGPTWKFWQPRVVPPAPEDFHPMGRNFARNATERDYIPWELFPGDPYPTSVNILLEHYIRAIEFCHDWKEMEKGLYIYHESCWYRSLLHPRYRHMANAQYDEQLARFLYKKHRIKGLAIATNNWTTFESAWNDLEDEVTDVCFDAFDYRVKNIIPDPAMPLDGFRPEMQLWLYHCRADTYETLMSMPSLRNLTIVNFQWAFDDLAEASSPEPEEFASMFQNLVDIPGASNSLQKVKLVGDIFYKVPPEDEAQFVGNEDQRKLARFLVTAKFTGGPRVRNKIDLSWMRFKYLNRKEWDIMMQPGPIGKQARARVRFESNDIPACNRYPTWETWDEIDQWKEVEIQGWKVYENIEGYPVIIDETRMWLDISLTDAGFDGALEEKMAAWSARLHKEKDAPYDPVILFFARWHRTALSRFRMQIHDFYTIYPWAHWV